MNKEIQIEGSRITGITSFYQEINRVCMNGESWQLGESLDAFDDMLYGGYGVLKDYKTIVFLWKDMERSRQALGYETTQRYYEQKLQAGPHINKRLFEQKLADLKNGKGQTYFDILLDIIASHSNITLKAV